MADTDSEAHIEDKTTEFARGNGWLVRKVAWIGRTGAPDRLFLRDGRHVWVEFKRKGGTATLRQKREHKRMRQHGAEVYVINSIEAGRALFA